MVINHKLGIIFLKTVKVGGTSFEIALSKYCDTEDIITPISPEDEKTRFKLKFQSPVNFMEKIRHKRYFSTNHPNSKIKGDFYNHIEAWKIYKLVGPEIFNRYKKIAIHRNPLDQLISLYFWQTKKNPENKTLNFRKWLVLHLTNPKKVNIMQRNYIIAPLTVKFSINFLIRYEMLNEDIKKISLLPKGIQKEFSAINTKSHHRPKNTRNSIEFFKENGCSDFIQKIIEFSEKQIKGNK